MENKKECYENLYNKFKKLKRKTPLGDRTHRGVFHMYSD